MSSPTSKARSRFRIAASGFALGLFACGPAPETPQNLAETRPPVEQAAPVERVACAKADEPLAPTCTLDREAGATGQIWTIRHPDGSFRRLRVVGDEVSEADGADPLVADGDAVRIGSERYRLPHR